MRSSRSLSRLTALACVGVATVTGCATPSLRGESSGSGSASSSTADSSRTSPSTATGSTSRSSTSAQSSASSAAPQDPEHACAVRTVEQLSPQQRVGQLLMVGLDVNDATSALDPLISEGHLGNVIYLGGYDSGAQVKKRSTHLQSRATQAATGGIPLLIAADQEGGEVQQLRGDGFDRLPSASEQAQMTPTGLTTAATGWARQLKAVGVNVNLAPVTDTVPASLGRANDPIGRWGRQYGSDPDVVARASTAFLKGMHAGGVEAVVKHFPGLGRIRGNTDFTTSGITDTETTKDDPYLQPFQSGIDAGAGMVMTSSARYLELDPTGTPAMFSSAIVTGLLREAMGYDGVVITDDTHARSVRAVPAPERAVRVVRAGGDIVLTGYAPEAPAMLTALAQEAQEDPAFDARVTESATRVVALKARRGLVTCD